MRLYAWDPKQNSLSSAHCDYQQSVASLPCAEHGTAISQRVLLWQALFLKSSPLFQGVCTLTRGCTNYEQVGQE